MFLRTIYKFKHIDPALGAIQTISIQTGRFCRVIMKTSDLITDDNLAKFYNSMQGKSLHVLYTVAGET